MVFVIVMMVFFYYFGSLFVSSFVNVVLMVDVVDENIVFVEFEVEGMICGGCEKYVFDVVYDLEGVIEVMVFYENENIVVKFDDSKMIVVVIEEVIVLIGYKVLGYKVLLKEG